MSESLSAQLLDSLKLLRDYPILEVVLHRGVNDVKYRGAHTIRIVWSDSLCHFLVTSTSLVPAGMNADSTISFNTAEEVVGWLINS